MKHSPVGPSEFKRRCGPVHPSSDTCETPSHPVIALVCTLKVFSVGVASAKRPSGFSAGETEAQKDHKPSKEQRRKEKKVGGNGVYAWPFSTTLGGANGTQRGDPEVHGYKL